MKRTIAYLSLAAIARGNRHGSDFRILRPDCKACCHGTCGKPCCKSGCTDSCSRASRPSLKQEGPDRRYCIPDLSVFRQWEIPWRRYRSPDDKSAA